MPAGRRCRSAARDRLDADRHADFGLHAALWPGTAGFVRRRAWRRDRRRAGGLMTACPVPAVLLGVACFTGIYMSAQGFYRFAAADTASDAFRPKAISWVMAGGLLSAVFGPQLVKPPRGDGGALPWHLPCGDRAEPGRGGLFLLLRKIPKPRARRRAPGGPQPRGADAHPGHRGGDDLRHGLLCADEPGDDLVAAGGGGLRL
jgi:hypothetical protein